MTSFFVFLSIILSAFALVLALFASPPPTDIQISTILNVLGIIVTSIAFIIGCYFALKATYAYRHIKELDEQLKEARLIKEKLNEEIENISTSKDKIFLNLVDTLKKILELEARFVLSRAAALMDEREREEINKLIDHCRGTLFYFKQVSNQDRSSFLKYLIKFGDKADLEKLQTIIHDQIEDENIRVEAKEAYKMILERLTRESKSSNSLP